MFGRSRLNKCEACGQWAGKSHHCPTTSAPVTASAVYESIPPRGTDATNRAPVEGRVARAIQHLAENRVKRERNEARRDQLQAGVERLSAASRAFREDNPDAYGARISDLVDHANDAMAAAVNDPSPENIRAAQRASWDAYEAVMDETWAMGDTRRSTESLRGAMSRTATAASAMDMSLLERHARPAKRVPGDARPAVASHAEGREEAWQRYAHLRAVHNMDHAQRAAEVQDAHMDGANVPVPERPVDGSDHRYAVRIMQREGYDAFDFGYVSERAVQTRMYVPPRTPSTV